MFTDINRDVKAGHQMSSLYGKELSLQVGTIMVQVLALLLSQLPLWLVLFFVYST